jgi:hypothetical protein
LFVAQIRHPATRRPYAHVVAAYRSLLRLRQTGLALVVAAQSALGLELGCLRRQQDGLQLRNS